MLRLGLTLGPNGIAVLGRVASHGIRIAITNGSQDENTAIGTTIGTLSVVNGAGGTYTFTKTADPDSAFTLTGTSLKNAIVFDYETATSHNVTLHADNGAGSTVDITFSIQVNDLADTAPPPTLDFSGTYVATLAL